MTKYASAIGGNIDTTVISSADDSLKVINLVEYHCERCGFVYNKTFDFQPFLCYRCMRFIAKRVYVTMNTITPLARTEHEDL